MTRATVFLAILLVSLNSAAFAIGASGVGEDIGIQPSPGEQQTVEDAKDAGRDVTPQTSQQKSFGIIGAVFHLFTTFFDSVTGLVFAAPTMLANLGFPSWATTLLFGPVYLVVGADAVYLLTARLM